MIKYKIIDGQGDIDPLHQIIHKTGKETKDVSVQFTMADIQNNINFFKKTITEKEGQAKVHLAEMNNVLENHPKVKDIEEKLQQAVFVYVQSKIKKAKMDAEADSYKAALAELEKEADDITKSLHLPVKVNLEDLNE